MGNKTASVAEGNKSLVLQFFSAVENNNLGVFDKIAAEDYNDHLPGQSPGREVLKKYFSGLHAAFSNLKLPVWAVVAEGAAGFCFHPVEAYYNK
jgi:predicted SnoaL-like aldol condensation-catalyzing enzyme